jgi:hypothetical protein
MPTTRNPTTDRATACSVIGASLLALDNNEGDILSVTLSSPTDARKIVIQSWRPIIFGSVHLRSLEAVTHADVLNETESTVLRR